MSKPIVYVVQIPQDKNITEATKFGTLKTMLQGNEPLQEAVAKLDEALVSFTENDFLLLIGKSTYMGLATHFAAVNVDTIQFLIWEGAVKNYKIEKVKIYE